MSNTSTASVEAIDPTNCEDGDRHCQPPSETNLYNIFQHPDNDDDDDDDGGDNTTTVDNGCALAISNEDGSYGIVNHTHNNENSDGLSSSPPLSEIIVAFQYQIQTSLPISSFQSWEDTSNPLVMIEMAISNVLIQDYFSNPACASEVVVTTGTRRRLKSTSWIRNIDHRHTQQVAAAATNETGWIGLTILPYDRILPGLAGVTCHSKLVEYATSCFTVAGALTATTTTTTNTSWIEFGAKQTIRNAMNQQLWNNIHDQIYNVMYVSDDPGPESPQAAQGITTPIVPTTAPNPETSHLSRDNDFPVWSWIFVPLGVILLGIALYELYRWMQKRRRLYHRHLVMHDSGRPHSASGNCNNSWNAPSPPQQRYSRTVIDDGPFISGSFPNDASHNNSHLSSKSFIVNEYDNIHEGNDVVIVDTTTTNLNHQRGEYDNFGSRIRNEHVPICDFEGLDVVGNDTSYDTEYYYNSIASSTDHESSNDTKGLSGTHGHFPSTVAFIT